jgi:hypothetical protein
MVNNMRVAYVTVHDPTSILTWSGTVYYIAKSLEQQGVDVRPIGPLKDKIANKVGNYSGCGRGD